MNTEEQFEERLKLHEGLVLKPYKDINGFLTIGWGHNLSANGITLKQAEMIFQDDISEAKERVAQNIPWSIGLPSQIYFVLVELAFWIGIGGLLKFKKMLGALKIMDYKKASAELMDSEIGRDETERTQRLANIILR